MSSYPLPTLAAQISATGISAPAFEAILNSKIATYQSIYGSDVVLTPDTQDGQLISIESTAINDLNNLAIAVYNSYAPNYAQGVGLSALVQTNGLARISPTNSTAVLEIGGVFGTIIQNGQAVDENANLWNLPAEVTIPESGSISVTATAAVAGAISAGAGTINQPYTIITGWQTVTNPAAATPGIAVEKDAALRKRQAASTGLPAQTPLSSIAAAIANLTGVGRIYPYENQSSVTDSNGVPSHSIAMIVEGGNITSIAQTIQQKKAPGTGTYGTTSVTVEDQAGIPITINFFELSEIQIYVTITLTRLAGWVSTTETEITNAIVAYLNSLPIGENIYASWVQAVASLPGTPLAQTFAITNLQIGTSPGVYVNPISIGFNQAPLSAAGNVSITAV